MFRYTKIEGKLTGINAGWETTGTYMWFSLSSKEKIKKAKDMISRQLKKMEESFKTDKKEAEEALRKLDALSSDQMDIEEALK